MSGKKLHYGWWIMASCCVMMACGWGMVMNTAGIFLVPVGTSLAVSRGTLSLYITIMTLSMSLTAPFAGRVYAKLKIEKILTVAYIIMFLCFGLLSTAKSVYHFYISAAIIGVSATFAFMLPVPILMNNWFKKRLGLVMGIALSFTGIGGAIFSLVAGSIITTYSWRISYLILAVVGAVFILPLTLFVIKTKPGDKGLRPYGAESDESEGYLVDSTATGTDKNDRKNIAESPVPVLQRVTFWESLFFAGALGLAGSFFSHVPAFSASLGYSPLIGSMTNSALMMGIVISKIGIGSLRDRFGLPTAITTGLTIGLSGALILLFSSNGMVILIIGALFMGSINGMAVVGPPLVVKSKFAAGEYNQVFSYNNAATNMLGAVGVALYGFIFDLSQSYFISFFIIISVISSAYLMFLLLRKQKNY